jgi:DNA-binding NarL/FixJ family response regulator
MAAAQTGSESVGTRVLAALVGSWAAMADGRTELRSGALLVRRAPAEARHLKQVVAAERPAWLLVGADLDEAAIRSLVPSGQAVHPELRLAMLGEAGDVRRCARWMRRGCQVYLERSVEASRVADAIDVAQRLRVVVVDRVFNDIARSRQVQLVDHLTRREEEVLRLIRDGHRNADIAQELHLTENTVEFHVSRLLAKLGARNRVEAVDRALGLGLT